VLIYSANVCCRNSFIPGAYQQQRNQRVKRRSADQGADKPSCKFEISEIKSGEEIVCKEGPYGARQYHPHSANT
jgi:hypothetical protein